MTTYTFRYKLTAPPQPFRDGSGMLSHILEAEASPDGAIWYEVPTRQRTILIPASEAIAALGAGTNSQVVQAYKSILAANLDTQAEPIVGWGSDDLQALMDANDAAQNAAIAVNAFVTDALGLTFPVRFTL